MTPRFRTTSGRILLPILVVIYLVGLEIDYTAKICPDGVRTVADHFLRFGEPRRVTQLQRDGGTYFELSGISRRSWSFSLKLPSSPPAYVYDGAGNFMDWCSDPGDQPAHRDRWPRADAKPLSPTDLRQKFGL